MKFNNLLASFLLIICLTTCGKQEQPKSETNQAPRPTGGLDSPVLEGEPAEMREALQAAYRLSPDNRAAQAITQIDKILNSPNHCKVNNRFSAGHWLVHCGKQQIGTLPEFPDFSDFMQLLTAYAGKLASSQHLILSPEKPGDPGALFARDLYMRLEEANKAWTGKDTSALYSATRSLTWLNLQSWDLIEVADSVAARAMATLAVTKAMSSEMLREEALLAYSMHYTGHAARIANQLAKDDPVRSFILRDDKELEKSARAGGANAQTKYLYLLQISKKGDPDQWEHERQRLFGQDSESVAVIRTGLDLKEPPQMEAKHLAWELAGNTPQLIEHEIGGKPTARAGLGKLAVSLLGRNSARFENQLEEFCKPFSGPFVEKDLCNSYYRAFYYSAFYKSEQSAGARSGGISSDLEKWRLAKQELIKNSNTTAVIKYMSDPSALGASAYMSLFDDLAARVDWDTPPVTSAARKIIGRMDTRVLHRSHLAYTAAHRLHDVAFAEKLYASILQSSSTTDNEIVRRAAVYLGNDVELAKILQSSWCDSECGSDLLWGWSYNDRQNDAIKAQYEELIKRYPSDWNPTNYYISFLRDRREYRRACEITDQWMRTNDDPSHVGYYHSHIRQSRNYFLAGDYESGLNVVRAVEDSTFGKREKAQLLNGLGKKDEAERYAKEALSDVPHDPETRIALARILWENAKYDEAAKVLQSAPRPFNTTQWCHEVGPEFAAAFEKRKETEAEQALAALQRAHVIKWNLNCFGTKLAEIGNPELAFKIQSHLQPSGSADMDVAIKAYQFLKAWKGKEEATQWLLKEFPPKRLNPLSMKALFIKEYDLLWDVIQEPDPRDNPERVWFFRAVGWRLSGSKNGEQKERLMEYYRGEKKDGSHIYGQFLLGIVSEQDLFARFKDAKGRCDTAYCLGVNAESDGRYSEAMEWYRVAIETASRSLSRSLALTTLSAWSSPGRGLSVLLKNPVLLDRKF
jgi:hypothetical protein